MSPKWMAQPSVRCIVARSTGPYVAKKPSIDSNGRVQKSPGQIGSGIARAHVAEVNHAHEDIVAKDQVRAMGIAVDPLRRSSPRGSVE